MQLSYTTTNGVTKFFDTEMLQLDLSGGTLPANARLRLSPTARSLGQTTIRSGSLPFTSYLSGFFDINTEISFDGGTTWRAATGAQRVELLAPFMYIRRDGTNAVISWAPPEFPELLQTAATVTGVWANVIGATNSYRTTATASNRFYRVTPGP